MIITLTQGPGSPSWGKDERTANYVVTLTPHLLGGYTVCWYYPNDPMHTTSSRFGDETIKQLMQDRVWVKNVPARVLLPDGI